ncbi:MAG: hypothetical protein AAF288_08900 [Planctomycetota bacterium]
MIQALRRWSDAAQTVTVTTIIALLIWAYAESASVETYTDQPIQVAFVGPEGQLLGIDPAEVSVEVTFRASKAQLADLRERLSQGPIEIPVGRVASDTGEELVDYARRLTEVEFASLGINIDEVRPESATVRVDPLVTLTLPVDVQVSNLPVSLARVPQAEPSEVQVTLPARLAANAAGLRIGVRVDRSVVQIDPSSLSSDGAPIRTVAPIVPPPVLNSRWTEYTPRSVMVELFVEQQAGEYRIETRSVKVMTPPSLWDRYEVTLPSDQRVVNAIRLRGPSAAIEAVRANNAQNVHVTVSLTSSDLDAAARSGQPAPHLLILVAPPGVEPAEPLGSVDIVVRERAEPSVPGPSADADG